jgi:hypothetical protein
MSDDELKSLFESLRQDNAAAHADTRREMREAIGAVNEENADTRREMQETARAIREENADTRREMQETTRAIREENAVAHSETRRHFDVTAERLDQRFDFLAESVQHVHQKLDREAADIRDEMRRGFADTQAMMKFSHAELDRRVRTLEDGHRSLEETVSDLQSRVERLESSTH